jgi:hypothetical protein
MKRGECEQGMKSRDAAELQRTLLRCFCVARPGVMGNDEKPRTVNSLQILGTPMFTIVGFPLCVRCSNRWATSKYLATPQTD